MMTNFRRTFFPTPEEQIQDLEMILRVHEGQRCEPDEEVTDGH